MHKFETSSDEASALTQTTTFLTSAVQLLQSMLDIQNTVGSQYRRARFGAVGDMLYICRVVNTDLLRDTHWNINFWTDTEVLAWKTSFISTCNAISVAGAIFATLGLTALQLPDLYATHWTARACLISSMVLGILSVTTATGQQQAIGMLNNPLAIRLWLSRGQPEAGKHAENRPFNILPLEASVPAIKFTTLPRLLLQLAVFVFLVGFGLYLLFGWLGQVSANPSDYRDILLVFLVTVGSYCVYQIFWTVLYVSDERKRTIDFDLSSRGSYEQPYYLEKLKRDLDRVQNLAAEMEREQMQKYAHANGITMEDLQAKLRQRAADEAAHIKRNSVQTV